ncbi:MAG: hypothetical protein V4525_08750 [Pseudomonadota bacterium]
MSITPAIVSEIDQLVNQGYFKKAKERLSPKLKTESKNAWVHFTMGTIHLLEGDLSVAEHYLKKALEIDPYYISAYSNLGVVYARKQAPAEEIIQTFNKILEINPSHYATLLNLGKYYIQIARAADVHTTFKKLRDLTPETPEQRGHYLSCIFALRYHEEIIENIGRLRECNYDAAFFDVGIFPLFSAMRQYCFWEDSKKLLPTILHKLEYENKNLVLSPYMEVNMVALAMPELPNDTLLRLHKLAAAVAKREMKGAPYTEYPQLYQPAKKWKIGIFSPDFRKHIVDAYLQNIIRSFNRHDFEIICYSNTKCTDHVTAQYASIVDDFVDVNYLTDRELAERIYNDGIHILIHATVYSVGSRTEFIFYNPAPLQIMYLGYPFTSGIESIDFFISDHYLNGPENAQYFVEKQLCMPESFIRVDDTQDQVITKILPVEKNGYISFGSLIQPYKINEAVIACWANIMREVSDSKMILNNPGYQAVASIDNICAEFKKYGIERERLQFIWVAHPEGSHFRYYNTIDIALDAFPMTGGATTMDALWMGVPVVTLVGNVFHERISYSMIKNVGLPLDDCIAFSHEEYIQKATDLAHHPEKIAYYRQAIPACLKTSVLRDEVKYTRQFEQLLLEGWDQKFSHRPVQSAIVSTQAYPLPKGSVLVTENNLNDVFNYVFQEQGAWYEAEWKFLQQLVAALVKDEKRSLTIWDIGAGVGHYALALAENGRYVEDSSDTPPTSNGVWVATQQRVEADLIRASIESTQASTQTSTISNHLAIHIVYQGEYKLRLDELYSATLVSGIDIVRIGNGFAISKLFKEGEAFFNDHHPVIMFELTRTPEGKPDLSFAEDLRRRGYQLFKLFPGIPTLAPYLGASELDEFTSNLFACKPASIKKLQVIGYIITSIPEDIALPSKELSLWQHYVESLPYLTSFLPVWEKNEVKPSHWEAYQAVLDLYAQARVLGQAAEIKVASLQGALNISLQLAQHELRLSRAVTLVRILVDLGKRADAVNLLTHLCTKLDASAPIIIDEPFVAISDSLAPCSTLEQLGRLVFADLLYQREKLRMFSSYFTGAEILNVLQAIESAGLGNAYLRKRQELIRERFALNQ